MPDLVSHAVVAPLVGGTVSMVIGAVFGITPEVLLAAFIGALIGVIALEAQSFKRAVIVILIGTMSVGYLIPLAFNIWPNLAQVSLAFGFGFIVVYFHEIILTSSSAAIKRLFSKIGA